MRGAPGGAGVAGGEGRRAGCDSIAHENHNECDPPTRRRRRRALEREHNAEEAAGEAMGRMARAFILLCMLRVVIAQHHRRQLAAQLDHARGGPLLPI